MSNAAKAGVSLEARQPSGPPGDWLRRCHRIPAVAHMRTVTDACYTKEGEKIAAGMPMGAKMLKCELKAVDRKDYSVPLTDVQFAAIKATFVRPRR